MQSYCWISTSYERLVWDYKKADIESIKQALILTNWDHPFPNKDVYSNYTPNKVVTFDDRDPPRMTEFIKFKIQQRISTYKNYHQKNSKSLDYEILQSEIENSLVLYLKERVTTTIS